MTLENIKLLYKFPKAVIKLFNYYSSIVTEAKYKIIHGKGIPSMLACMARVAPVAKLCDLKVSDHWNLKILRPKQMFQGLSVALAQVKAGNTSKNLLN